MRNRRSDLQELIQCLDTAEVRHCLTHIKEHHSQHSPRLLQLFNALRKTDTADEKKLKTHLTNQTPGWDFAHYKNLLSALIHESLVGYRKSDTVENRLLYLLELEKVLFGKNLFVQCHRLLTDARQTAELYEYHWIELELLKRQGSLLNELFPDDFRTQLKQIATRRLQLNSLIAAEAEYRNLCQLIFLLKRKYSLCRSPQLKKELLKLQGSPLLKNNKKALSFRSQRFLHNAQAHIHELLGNFSKTLEHLQHNYKLWQKHPHQQKEKSAAYLATLIHLCNTLFCFDRYTEAKEILQQAENIKLHGSVENSSRFRQLKLNQLLLCLNTADFAAIPPLLEEIKQGLKIYSLPESYALSLIHNAAVCCFVMQNYSETLQWLLRINKYGRTGERQDIRDFSLLFTLVVWYAAGKHDLVENHLRSAKRYYKNNNLLYPLEIVVVELLHQLLASPSVSAAKQVAQTMQPQFAQLKHRPLGTAELTLWLQSMATAKPIKELLH